MAATDPKYVIRYPEELRQRVAASAKTNGRSINAEICFQLKTAYDWAISRSPEADAMMRNPFSDLDRLFGKASDADRMDRMDRMAGNS